MAKPLLALLCAAVAACLAQAAGAADLGVAVNGLRSNDGNVHIAVYDRAETFPDGDGMLAEVEVSIENREASHTFTGLKVGDYAVAVYHDENDNDAFDTNFIGLPMEGYAFSNGATVFLGPPSFAEARIFLPVDGATADIKMTY